MPHLHEKTIVRFWATVDKSSGADGCWPRKGVRTADGYARFQQGDFRSGTLVQWAAHRLAWALTFGEIPSGMCICHHCDNPPCCNPSHLFLGTHLDNVRDKVAKGRQAREKCRRKRIYRGEKHPGSKLTDAQREMIAARLANNAKVIDLARELGVDRQTARKYRYWVRSRETEIAAPC